jgi:hypothetical protein
MVAWPQNELHQKECEDPILSALHQPFTTFFTSVVPENKNFQIFTALGEDYTKYSFTEYTII